VRHLRQRQNSRAWRATDGRAPPCSCNATHSVSPWDHATQIAPHYAPRTDTCVRRRRLKSHCNRPLPMRTPMHPHTHAQTH
jgi:hypothetical protein